MGSSFSFRHFGISSILCVSMLLSPRMAVASQPIESSTEDLLLLRSGAVGTDPGRPFPGSGAAGRGGGEAQFRGGEAEFRGGEAEFRGGDPVFRGWTETGTEQAVQGPDTIVNLSAGGVRSMSSLAMPSMPSFSLTPPLPAVPGMPGVPGVPRLSGMGLPGLGLGAAGLLAGVPNMVPGMPNMVPGMPNMMPGMPSMPGTDLLSTLGIMGALSIINSLPQMLSALPQQLMGMVNGLTGMAYSLTQLPQNMVQSISQLPQTLAQTPSSTAQNLVGMGTNLAHTSGNVPGIGSTGASVSGVNQLGKNLSVILMGGLDNRNGDLSISQQVAMIEKGGLDVIGHRYNDFGSVKKSISQNPNAIVVLFSAGCYYSGAIAKMMSNKANLFIVEPYAVSANTSNSVRQAVLFGVPSSNVITGPTKGRGLGVVAGSTPTPSGVGHWGALQFVQGLLK